MITLKFQVRTSPWVEIFDAIVHTNEGAFRAKKINLREDYFLGELRLPVEKTSQVRFEILIGGGRFTSHPERVELFLAIGTPESIDYEEVFRIRIDGFYNRFITPEIRLKDHRGGQIGYIDDIPDDARLMGDPEERPRRSTLSFNKEAEPPRQADPKKDPGGEVELFYATNRNLTGENNPNDYYGDQLSDLKLGKAVVSIPPGHEVGELERPRKILWWNIRKENKQKDIVLSSVQEMSIDDYYSWLSKGIAQSETKAALIFIHGYNTDFAEAAWRAGQITYDIPFNNGISGFFSWPSSGKKLDYMGDFERARASVGWFMGFIKDLVATTNVKQLHFIAHSMGNVVLTEALKELANDKNFANDIHTVSQVVLAAPDIDKDVFNASILPAIAGVGVRRTLYANDQDRALKWSRRLRAGLIRIGEAGDRIFVAKDLDTVDASNVASEGNHHSYMFETKELLADIYYLLTENKPPVDRRLRAVPKDALEYWLFRE